MKPSEIAERVIKHYRSTDSLWPSACDPPLEIALARAYLRLREAVEGIEDYNAEHHLDTICAPCMRMVKDALRQALEETDDA